VANGTVAEMDLTGIEDQFEPSALEAFTYNGTLYGMPYATENIAFFCNPDIVETMPATWDDVMALSEELAAEGITGWTIETNDPYHWFPQITAFGGYVFGVTEEGYDATDVGLDSEGAIAAAEWLGQMVDAGFVQPGMDRNTRLALYNNGDLACFNGGPWDLPDLRDAGTPYMVGPFPAGTAGPGEPFLGVQGFMISPFSEDPLLAQAFLTDFVATQEVMFQLYEAGGRPPAFLPALELVEDEDLQAFAEVGANARPMPAIPEMNAVWAAWGNAQELIIGGTLEPEEAMLEAAQQVRDAIGAAHQ
ncbi:MAG: extracellular solute-binding protein, partial [Chloroflexi bacterium]|nr:extracellular solute-binding protein [Chloroflexota bacterium]